MPTSPELSIPSPPFLFTSVPTSNTGVCEYPKIYPILLYSSSEANDVEFRDEISRLHRLPKVVLAPMPTVLYGVLFLSGSRIHLARVEVMHPGDGGTAKRSVLAWCR